MLALFQQIVRTDFPDIQERAIFLAISGGKDSMVLSHLLSASAIDHTLLHCNFQLRGQESEEDEAFLLQYAAREGLSIEVKRCALPPAANGRKGTIQSRARQLRYDWFEERLQKDERALLLTAHHLDDSIETFFINVLRGSGIRGIRGIQKHNGYIYRPLLSFSADELEHYGEQHRIVHREDASNQTDKYMRNRIRHQLIPVLQRLNPSFKKPFKALLEENAAISSWIDEEVRKFKAEKMVVQSAYASLPLNDIQSVSPFFLLSVFSAFGVNRAKKAAFTAFLDARTGALFHTSTHEFLIDRNHLLVRKKDRPSVACSSVVVEEFPRTMTICHLQIRLDVVEKQEIARLRGGERRGERPFLTVCLRKIQLPITVRKWKRDDTFKPLGMKGRKSVADFLTDRKISLFEKENVVVLTDRSSEIIALHNLAISDAVKLDEETTAVLRIDCCSLEKAPFY